MSTSLGDFATSTVVYGKFTTYRPSTGAPFTLAGTPALSVYKDNSTTQSTAGVTLTVDFDGVTGLHHFAIDTSADGTFYAAGSFFDIVITAGTVDSVSAVGTVVGSFTLAKGAAFARLGAPAGASVSADVAAIKAETASILADTAEIGAAGAGLTALATQSSVNTIDTVVDAILVDTGTDIPASLATIAGYIDTEVAATLAAVDTEVAAIKAKTDSLTFTVAGQVDANALSAATGVISAAALASDAANEIADALLDRANGIETGLTPRQAWRLETAAAAGKVSGAATTTVVIRNAVADSKARITATVDADGNRSAITTDLT